MNKVILMGRLTKDVETRTTPNDVTVARFSIAVNRRYKDQSGDYPVDFINCVAWRQTAEFVSRYFSKGSMISVVGSIQTRTWEDENQKKQYATDINVEEVYFCGSKNDGAQPPTQQPSTTQTPDFDMNEFADLIGDESDLPF